MSNCDIFFLLSKCIVNVILWEGRKKIKEINKFGLIRYFLESLNLLDIYFI